MPTTTPNLGLTLYNSTTDQSTTFATYRAVWGGTATTSNFYKIDTWAGSINVAIDELLTLRGAITVNAIYVSENYYEATVAEIEDYESGMSIILSVSATTDGTTTLNINSLGTKSLMKVNSSGTPINLTGSDLVIGRKYLFQYDGTRFLWVSANSADQIQIVGTAGNVVTVGSSNNLIGSTTPLSFISTIITSASGKTSPVGADVIVIGDSESTYSTKSVLLSNLYKGIGSGTQSSNTFLNGTGAYSVPNGVVLSDVLVVTSSGTFEKGDYPGLYGINVRLVGGGGGGGGVTGASSQASVGGAGSGGGYSEKFILVASLDASETVTIGSGGSGGAAGNNAGSSGNTTSFGSHCQGTGGGGGNGMASTSVLPALGGDSGEPGVGSGGDINIKGNVGVMGLIPTSSANVAIPSVGGGTPFAGSVAPVLSSGQTNGINGDGYGGGGSGGFSTNNAVDRAGGNGANGVCIIYVYKTVS
jgi:hypothetical protein